MTTAYKKNHYIFQLKLLSQIFFLLFRYFTLDENKNPVGGNFAWVKGEEDKEEEWGVKDYI